MRPLRILHVNTAEMEGGAGRAVNRLHRALRGAGVDSHMLVLHRSTGDEHVLQPLGPAKLAVHRVKVALSSRLSRVQRTPTNPVCHSLNFFSSGLGPWIDRSDFDVVNLHWLGEEMLSIEEIGRIGKPLCWTLHDTWAFSGTEHYDDLEYPGRYRGGYARADRPPTCSGPDLDGWNWRRKRRAWAGQDFQLIGPSRWIARCALESALFAGRRCAVVPNCLDSGGFKPTQPEDARRALGLDLARKYILFGGVSGAADRRKGFHLLQEALGRLTSTAAGRNTELLVFGADAASGLAALPLPARHMGMIQDDARLALLYSAADAFAAPSMQDNLPNTVMEALACGTPCVAFSIGGMPDLIEHGITGWLAKPYSGDDYCEGLLHVLRTPSLRQSCGTAAVRRYGMSVVAQQYEQLYRGLVASSPGRLAAA